MDKSDQFVEKSEIINQLLNKGEYDKAREKIENWKPNADDVELIKLLIYQSHILSQEGSYSVSIEYIEKAIDLANGISNNKLILKAQIERIYCLWYMGETNKGLSIIKENIPKLDQLPNTEEGWIIKSDFYNAAGILANNVGQIKESLKFFKKSLSIKEKLGMQDEIAVSLNNLGIIYKSQGKLEKALKVLKRSKKIKEEVGTKYDVANTMSNIALLHRKMGRINEGLKNLEEIYPAYKKYGNTVDRSGNLLNLVIFNCITDRIDEAKQYMDELEDLVVSNSESTDMDRLHFEMAGGIFSQYKGDFNQAKHKFKSIIEGPVIDHHLYLTAIEHLIEINILQLEDNYQPIFLERAFHYIDELKRLTSEENLYLTQIAALLLESKLNLQINQFTKAQSLAEEGLEKAELNNAGELINEANNLLTLIDKNIQPQLNPVDGLRSINIKELGHYVDLLKSMDI